MSHKMTFATRELKQLVHGSVVTVTAESLSSFWNAMYARLFMGQHAVRNPYSSASYLRSNAIKLGMLDSKDARFDTGTIAGCATIYYLQADHICDIVINRLGSNKYIDLAFLAHCIASHLFLATILYGVGLTDTKTNTSKRNLDIDYVSISSVRELTSSATIARILGSLDHASVNQRKAVPVLYVALFLSICNELCRANMLEKPDLISQLHAVMISGANIRSLARKAFKDFCERQAMSGPATELQYHRSIIKPHEDILKRMLDLNSRFNCGLSLASCTADSWTVLIGHETLGGKTSENKSSESKPVAKDTTAKPTTNTKTSDDELAATFVELLAKLVLRDPGAQKVVSDYVLENNLTLGY